MDVLVSLSAIYLNLKASLLLMSQKVLPELLANLSFLQNLREEQLQNSPMN